MSQRKQTTRNVDNCDEELAAATGNIHLSDYLNLGVTQPRPKLPDYEGFNAQEMRSIVLKKSEKQTVFGTRAKDIRFGIVLFNERGNKILGKSTPEEAKMNEIGFNDMKKWANYYSVVSTATEPTTLTPAKWTMLFPLSTCGYTELQKNWIIKPQESVPKCIYCPAFSSLIITDNERIIKNNQSKILMKAAAYYQYQLSEIIGKPAYKSHSVQEKKKKSFQYVEYWAKNSHESIDDKLKFLIDHKILIRCGHTHSVTLSIYYLAQEFDKIV